MKRDFSNLLQSVTSSPGVYQMHDAAGVIIYVGKAKNLKKRISSYFKTTQKNTKTSHMIAQVDDIAVTVTRTEAEALLLECNLIKAHAPRYNILLRDDKSFPYIALNTKHPFPKLHFYRGKSQPHLHLFGPYPNVTLVRETLNFLQQLCLIRNCKDSEFANRSTPCLQYQIKRCSAPCVGYVTADLYQQQLTIATAFLNGKSDELLVMLSEKMQQASNEMNFEQAAKLRDQIQLLNDIQQQQIVTNTKQNQAHCDVLAVACEQGYSCVMLMMVRQGKLVGSYAFHPRLPEVHRITKQQVLEAFIGQHYLGSSRYLPSFFLVSTPLSSEFEHALKSQLPNLAIKLPTRGLHARWVAMAKKNAENALSQYISTHNVLHHRYQQLAERLGQPHPFNRIECFDISHTHGEHTMGSCVVFDSSGAVKSAFRQYAISGITPGDDYAAMKQVLKRRYQRLLNNQIALPQLVIVDGGKGQLNVAKAVMMDLNISHCVLLLGIAKGPSRKPGLESLMLSCGESEFTLESDDPLLHLLQRIRDEAHRFAITAHRNKRQRLHTHSKLEDIHGIGTKRRQALFARFGGLERLKQASIEEIMRVPGIKHRLASEIYKFLHPNNE